MRQVKIIPALILLAIGSTVCTDATGPIPPPPAEVVGCYELHLTHWSAPHEAPEPPPAIVLIDSLGDFLLESGKSLVRPAPGDTAYFPYMAWWERPVPDTLIVVFTTGYVGVTLHLVWRAEGWRGVGEAFTDVYPSLQARTSAALQPARTPVCGFR